MARLWLLATGVVMSSVSVMPCVLVTQAVLVRTVPFGSGEFTCTSIVRTRGTPRSSTPNVQETRPLASPHGIGPQD